MSLGVGCGPCFIKIGDGSPMFAKIISICAVLIILLTGCGTASRQVSGSDALQGEDTAVKSGPQEVNGIALNESAAVVADMVVDIFSEPDVRSQRIAQVIYNQVVNILAEDGNWYRIAAADGSVGWVRSKFIDRNISSISGRSYTHKIIVTGKEKSIFSDPAGGITLKNTVMGSVFYAFNTSDNAYEVYLPGNMTGWLKGSGIIHVGLDADVPVTSGEDFAASALKLKGTSYLLNGLSSMGIDSPGMIYICAKINGVNLPRDLNGQTRYGEEMDLSSVDTGDIVFLSESKDKNNISGAGIYLGNGQYIHASRASGYVMLEGLNESGSDGKPVFARRIFR